jgi:hypothetical protein
MLTASIGIAAFLVGAAAIQTPVDARRGGGVHMGGGSHFHAGTNRNFSANRNINSNVNRNISRNANINRNVDISRNRNVTVNRNVKYIHRNGQRGYWRNGVWIAAPLAAGATYGYVGSSSCSYLYNQWQKTNSIYWRDRYRRCVNGT